MALPTTNLAGHWDASTNAELYEAFSGGVLNTNPADGDDFINWRNERDSTNESNTETLGEEDSAHSISWHNDEVMNLPSAKINSGRLRTETAAGIGLNRTTFLPNTGKTLLLSFYLDGTNSTIPNHASVFQNCVLAGEARNNFFGLFIKQPSTGVYELHAYNWDGNADSVSVSLTADEPHTVCVVHDGTNLTLSLDCGTPVSVASGNTTSGSGALFIGDTGNNGTTTAEFRGRIGEVAAYDAALSGTDLEDAKEYFCNKWLLANQIRCAYALGENITVTASRAIGLGLDGNTNVHDREGTFAVWGDVQFHTLPTADPGVAGVLWNDSGVLKISAG